MKRIILFFALLSTIATTTSAQRISGTWHGVMRLNSIELNLVLHLDGDSTLVTSVTLINSPPFVPLVAALLNNKDLIVLGITIGLFGYLIGNYLGLAVFFILSP